MCFPMYLSIYLPIYRCINHIYIWISWIRVTRSHANPHLCWPQWEEWWSIADEITEGLVCSVTSFLEVTTKWSKWMLWSKAWANRLWISGQQRTFGGYTDDRSLLHDAQHGNLFAETSQAVQCWATYRYILRFGLKWATHHIWLREFSFS
jgi:hypothetical protein